MTLVVWIMIFKLLLVWTAAWVFLQRPPPGLAGSSLLASQLILGAAVELAGFITSLRGQYNLHLFDLAGPVEFLLLAGFGLAQFRAARIRRLGGMLALAVAAGPLAPPVAPAAQAADGKPGILVNLTTDDTWAATMAIMFAHKRALANGFSPVVIWLNVRGVNLADRNHAAHKHGLVDQDLHQMLAAFIKDGGVVYACPACSKTAGIAPADYLDGIKPGDPKTMLGLLADPDIKTLSW
ncbi:MAG: DsrE family protein [Flavobacteriales bacterium]|nr:DsrE family protein [Flavobacteriales bacterium]